MIAISLVVTLDGVQKHLTLTFVVMVTTIVQLYALGTVDIEGATVLPQCCLGAALSPSDLATSSDAVTGPI